MNHINVKICPMYPDVIVPKYETEGSAGCDVRAYLKEMPNVIIDSDNLYILLAPGETKLIQTGIKVKIPEGYVMDIRPRSGISLKTKLRVANSPGTVDSDYILPVGIIAENTGTTEIKISHGDRIAQFLFLPVLQANFEVVTTLEETKRNGGFGSTGLL